MKDKSVEAAIECMKRLPDNARSFDVKHAVNTATRTCRFGARLARLMDGYDLLTWSDLKAWSGQYYGGRLLAMIKSGWHLGPQAARDLSMVLSPWAGREVMRAQVPWNRAGCEFLLRVIEHLLEGETT